MHQYLKVVSLLCQYWAVSGGMRFAPEKSELLYLTCVHTAPIIVMRLGNNTVVPTHKCSFLEPEAPLERSPRCSQEEVRDPAVRTHETRCIGIGI